MAARGKFPAYEGRSVQAPGMMRHGPFPGVGIPANLRPMEPRLLPERAESKLAVQAAEMEQLAADNHRLAATHVALREDLATAQQEIQRVKGHIRSIQTESDIQIRVLLEKITKMEADIRAGESIKKDLQQAHMEAHGLVTSRQELSAEIQRATKELQKAHDDAKKLPEMHAELDSLRQEHQRLRTAFEYEKGLNMEQVEQMQAMEKDMLGMAREVEKLRAEVLKAEKRALVPNYSGAYVNHDRSYPNVQGTGAYVDGYGRPYGHMGVGSTVEHINLYGNTNGPAGGVAAVSGVGSGAVWGGAHEPAAASGAGSGAVWGGPHDLTLAPR
ncbi:protein FLX-like 4 isoform X1 [Malania oleifera]|uniref:protein FLX-like 4 isoform X1 n=1 Tax=Malania oleifera TaxID=397392 RepID=UPI0025AE89B5|nr:protein FLX-like 4 isoform X1 [Malania oleifera]XP_057967114.1 protein FLX-like 4 isoform X1 [Malania oleifera]